MFFFHPDWILKGWENKVGGQSKVGSPKKHEMVEPYIPRDITVESLTEIGKGGWLMRKRPDLNGRWDVMYTTFTNGSVLSYIVLSQKGSIDLYEAEVVETISADFFSDNERQKYPHAFALNSNLLEKMEHKMNLEIIYLSIKQKNRDF